MNHFTQSSNRNLRTFIATLLAYVLLTRVEALKMIRR
jgi:hypothetical protein